MKITIDTAEPLSDSDRTILSALANGTPVPPQPPRAQDAAVERAADPTFAEGSARVEQQPWEGQGEAAAGTTPTDANQTAGEAEKPARAKRRTKAQIAADEAAKAAAEQIQAAPAQQPVQVPPGFVHTGSDPAGQPIFQPAAPQGQPQEWAATQAPPLQQNPAPQQVLLGYTAGGEAIYGQPQPPAPPQQPQSAAVAPPWSS